MSIFLGLITLKTVSGQSTTDPVKQLNSLFRSAYSEARDTLLKSSGLVILVRGDQLVMIRNQHEIEGHLVNRLYDDLKTISHTPLTIYVLLRAHTDQPLPAPIVNQLSALADSITDVQNILESILNNEELRSQQHSLLVTCKAFITSVIQETTCSRRELLEFVRTLRPLILSNISECVRLRIDNYHSQMMTWKRELSKNEWSSIRIIIPGAALPRRNNLATTYFARLLGEQGEGQRIIYAESLFSDSEAMDLLGTHLLDTDIGVAFFEDPWRMHRDLLGDAAATYIETLDFNKTSSTTP
ncbi:MAG: hypothetical protein ABGW78_03285 [Pirellulales bacterium]